MLKTLRNTLTMHAMLSPGEHLVVALSGGADSVALLHGLLQLKTEYNLALSAVHVNHNLRAEASEDERFVTELCRRLHIPLRIYQADVKNTAEKEQLTIEEAGRKLRYALFQTVLSETGADKIAAGHNQNDNAETILLNLFRGTGLKGLCGIPPVNGNIIRPLIHTSRDEIEAYLRSRNLAFRSDASNHSHDYTRNRIRHLILPAVKAQINERAAAVMARNASILRTEDEFLSALAREAFKDCACEKEGRIRIGKNKLLSLPEALYRRVLRESIEKFTGSLKDINTKHTESLLSLARGQTGREIHLPSVCARLEYDEIILEKPYAQPEKMHYAYPLEMEMPVYIPEMEKYICCSFFMPAESAGPCSCCTKAFNYDKVNEFLMLRTRRPGDRIYLNGAGTKKLQDYFTDRKIPREKRDRIPLLADGQNILWIMESAVPNGGRTDSRYGASEDAKTFWVSVYK